MRGDRPNVPTANPDRVSCRPRVPVTLELSPLVVARTHASGAVYAYPLGDPELIGRADDLDQALGALSMFLAEHLARVPADVIATFAFPDTAVLHNLPMVIPRDDLERRFGIDAAIAVPCVAVPEGQAWWVHVLPLRLMVYVEPGEDLARRVTDETLRQLAAQDVGPKEWAALLPGHSHTLHRIPVHVTRDDHGDLHGRAESRRGRQGGRSRTEALALLAQIGTDVLGLAALRRGAPAVGRDDEVKRIAALLTGDERVGVALVGDALAGKTAVFETLLSQAVVPFRSSPVFATSGAALVAGQSGFGELAERVQAVMQAAALLDAVLYFDNLADLFAGRSGGVEDLGSALRPWIVDGRVRIVGECTVEAFERFEKQQPTLLACMHRVTIEPLGAEVTRTIVQQAAAHARRREPDRPSLAENAAAPLVELCERYLVDAAFPGKAVRLLDELRAIHRHDVDASGNPHVIGVHDVYRAFSLRTGMPMFLLREDQGLRRATLDAEFHRRVIGQREAITSVTEMLCTVKARLQPPGKPLANFLFVGPTGVGKTEVAKTLARILFGGPERMVRFDMSEYSDIYAAERLIRGTATDDGELTRKIRQQPFSVLLLDEIEKADAAVFDLLLQVLGEGRLTDARGRTTNFGNTIIIMTSNLGASHRATGANSGTNLGVGFTGPRHAGDEERRYYAEQVSRHFRPEFVNRIDRIIPFASLARDEIALVARVSMQQIRERAVFAQRGVTLEVTDNAMAALANRGYSAVYGARALRRQLEDQLVAPVAGVLSEAGALAEGATVFVALGDDEAAEVLVAHRATAHVIAAQGDLRIALVTAPATERGAESGIEWFSQLRRNAAAAMQATSLAELRQRAAYLTSELAAPSTSHARTAALAALREHQQITASLARVDEAHAAIESIEELALAAGAEADHATLTELTGEARAAHARFETAVVGALFDAEPRDGISVLVTAPAGLAPLARWLGWLDAWARQRKWTVLVHREGDRSAEWSTALPWGPGRELRSIREALDHPSEPASWRNLLLRVTGTHCGYLLHLECGLHRLWPADRTSADHLWIRAITSRTQLGEPELGTLAFAPQPRQATEALHRMPAVREVFADGVVTMPELGFTSVAGVDLGAPDVLERLWFGELVRRAREGLEPIAELPS